MIFGKVGRKLDCSPFPSPFPSSFLTYPISTKWTLYSSEMGEIFDLINLLFGRLGFPQVFNLGKSD